MSSHNEGEIQKAFQPVKIPSLSSLWRRITAQRKCKLDKQQIDYDKVDVDEALALASPRVTQLEEQNTHLFVDGPRGNELELHCQWILRELISRAAGSTLLFSCKVHHFVAVGFFEMLNVITALFYVWLNWHKNKYKLLSYTSNVDL